ncbi:MAG: transposase [Bacteroidaceae bacterium]|nr:transposase [Bacteroidaceae bacterium]
MARRQREKTATGIYHVMLRGINKQDVFLDDNDFDSMLSALREARVMRYEDLGITKTDGCTYYAYCMLHNHIHLLVREGSITISELMKKIQDRFVAIYNRKYDRVGHLFQDRFVSEPVNDLNYFHQLIRYIHRNPVKAMECNAPEEYKYSSWREYLDAKNWIIKGSDPLIIHLCDVQTVIARFGYEELVKWVNEDVDDKCMDMDSFAQPMPEMEVWERLHEISGVDSVEEFKQLAPDVQVKYISQLLQSGASLRQASRMSSLSYKALWNRLNPEEYAAELARKKEERKKRRTKMDNQGV